jgi:hypothetical protein
MCEIPPLPQQSWLPPEIPTEYRFAVAIRDGRVAVLLDEPMKDFGMSPTHARQFARLIEAKADDLDPPPPPRPKDIAAELKQARKKIERLIQAMAQIDGFASLLPSRRQHAMKEGSVLMPSYATDRNENAVVKRVQERLKSVDETEKFFRVHEKASLRAVAKWRADHPGQEMATPDYGDLLVYLMNRLAKYESWADETYTANRA